jgi:hypothetical protein
MPRTITVRYALIGVLATVCASAANASVLVQGSSPSLTIALNDTSFGPGQTISVTAKLTPGTVSAPVDAYIVVQLPTGGYLSLQLGGGLVPGIVPIARGIVPFPYEGTLVSYTFGGAEPLGTYTWFAMLTRPGTLEPNPAPQQTTFALSLSTPQTTKATLSTALNNGDIQSASALLGGVLIDVVGGLSASARNNIVKALETCSVVEARSGYQVCVTRDQRFRFVLVRDDLQKWRVVLW